MAARFSNNTKKYQNFAKNLRGGENFRKKESEKLDSTLF